MRDFLNHAKSCDLELLLNLELLQVNDINVIISHTDGSLVIWHGLDPQHYHDFRLGRKRHDLAGLDHFSILKNGKLLKSTSFLSDKEIIDILDRIVEEKADFLKHHLLYLHFPFDLSCDDFPLLYGTAIANRPKMLLYHFLQVSCFIVVVACNGQPGEADHV